MKSKIYFFLLLLSVSFACAKTQNAVSLEPDSKAATPIEQTKVAAVNQKQNTEPVVSLKNLREWIGKYPINKDDAKYRNFFQIPEVKQKLIEILKEEGFQKLLRHFSGTDVIKEKAGFLVMLGTTEKSAAQDVDYALLALNPDTGETHVLFADDGKLTSFGSAKGDGNLTAEIKQEILIYTASASENELIGTLKQKPAEGFACYAVLPKDWNTIAEKRQYIFVSTDDGGIFNIGGKDVEIKSSDSSETKGENGRTYAEWIFADKKIKAKFDLAVEKTLNEGADVQYEGTLTVTTDSKTQTIQIKAFCGG